MVALYVNLISNGLWTLEMVPTPWRKQVKSELSGETNG